MTQKYYRSIYLKKMELAEHLEERIKVLKMRRTPTLENEFELMKCEVALGKLREEI